MAIGTKWLVLL